MIVAGAGGHAKDLLEVFTQLNQLEELYFFAFAFVELAFLEDLELLHLLE